VRARPLPVCLVAVLATCGPPLPPDRELKYAVTTDACGPNGESYTAILLTAEPVDDVLGPSKPYLRIVLPVQRLYLTSDEWNLTFDDGVTADYFGENWDESVRWGTVKVTSVDGSFGEVDGTVDLELSAQVMPMWFKAPWITFSYCV
jgi:hypothetical protein